MNWRQISRLLTSPLFGSNNATKSPLPQKYAGSHRSHSSLLATFDDELRLEQPRRWYGIDPRRYESGRAILDASPEVQATIALELLDLLVNGTQRHRSFESSHAAYGHDALLKILLRRRLPFPEPMLRAMTRQFAGCESVGTFLHWLRPLIRAIELWIGKDSLSASFRQDLRTLRDASEAHATSAEAKETIRRIDALLGEQDDSFGGIETTDDWGVHARAAYDAMPIDLRSGWNQLLTHIAKAKGSKPASTWQRDVHGLIAAVGNDDGEAGQLLIRDWLSLLKQSAPVQPGPSSDGNGVVESVRRTIMGDAVPTSVISPHNGDILRGLAWCCASFDDAATAASLGDAAIACFKKIPDVGPRSAKVGNACIFALGQMGGIHGVAQLQRLRQRVTQRTAITFVEATMNEAAEREGMSRADLDELLVPTFNLVDGRRRERFGDFTGEIVVAGTQQVSIEWFSPDGKPRKTEPTALKREFPTEVKAFKKVADDIRAILPTQRDRIERLLLTERDWTCAEWRTRYLDHPLLSQIARRVIWRIETETGSELVGWHADTLVTVDDRAVEPSLDDRVRLWHPIQSDAATVSAWQDWLDRHRVTQPFKQAHREVYVLTDAERTTDVYSNRFAGHLLRQHQFTTLARQNDWTHRLQGGFDDSSTPTIDLPVHNLSAEFWVEPIHGGDDAYTPSGISVLVSTDQVRFRRTDGRQPIALTEIPPLVFTEVMRDVDLFVAVCSIGTDPLWADRGLQPYYGYWQRTAFSEELSASAQTRRVVLERLVPRLAIADRCHLDDKSLIVRGDIRTYKIHLGSGNILMEPNNQYLCIVAARGAAKDPAQGVFLPFEGDAMLSIILSKAFLLANDTAITDPTIVRQIK